MAAVSPLRVQLDGDAAPLPITPDSLVDPLTVRVSDRVRCELTSNRVTVLGRAGGLRAPLQDVMTASPGTLYYTRIATLSSNGGAGGASFECIISGASGYGAAERSTILLQASIRSAGAMTLRPHVINGDFANGGPPIFYTRYISDYVQEIWYRTADGFEADVGITELSNMNATCQNDSQTTTAPSGLIQALPEALESPTGTVISSVGNAAIGYLYCDGSAYSRTTYSRLFSVCGTNFGAGDGSTTFNVPNIAGRTIVGATGGEVEFNAMGKTGGEKYHTLSALELPEHQHLVTLESGGPQVVQETSSTPYSGWVFNVASIGGGLRRFIATTLTGQASSGGSHNNLQPYISLNHFIKY